jgi:hypothetical protein
MENVELNSFTSAGWTCPNCGSWIVTPTHSCTLAAGDVSKSFSTGPDAILIEEIQALRKELRAFHEQWASCNGVAVMPPLGGLKQTT